MNDYMQASAQLPGGYDPDDCVSPSFSLSSRDLPGTW